jgi:hypothetical protein
MPASISGHLIAIYQLETTTDRHFGCNTFHLPQTNVSRSHKNLFDGLTDFHEQEVSL